MATETQITTVINVTWIASKSGLLKPTVHFETVNISGTYLERVSGYNAKYLVDNKIGCGATIVITIIGGIIPKILEVLTPCPNDIQLPDKNVYGNYIWDDVDLVLLEKNK